MSSSVTERTNLLGLPRPALEAFVSKLGSRPFRARQLMSWIYKRGVADFAAMTDLARDFRSRLAEQAEVRPPQIVRVQRSSDGTVKWLLRADESQAFEMVFIPEPDRGTLCISSQVGCALDCSFCSTAQQGFNRNLSTAEIVGQVWLPSAELLPACWHYLDEQNGRSVTFEYVMLDGVNDSPAQARALARLLKGHPAKVNLIPFNPFPGTRYARSPAPVIQRFRDELLQRGVLATVRRTRGEDIDAACGQLAGRVIDRTTVRLGDKVIGVAVQA